MNKFFVDQTQAIFQLVKDNIAPDIGVAWDMFKADTIRGVPYNTQREDIDFAARKVRWDAMSEDDQNAARDDWHAFYGENFKALEAAWRDSDFEAFQAIIDNA